MIMDNKEKLEKFLKKGKKDKKQNVQISTEGELVETVNKTIIVENDGRQLMFD